MSLVWRQTFGSAPIDEITLGAVADDILAKHSFVTEKPEEVLKLCRDLDDNTATAVLYRYLAELRHREFVADVDARSAGPLNAQGKAKFLVVPGFFYAEHPDIGSGGDVVLASAAACGFAVDRVPMKSLGTVLENAAILKSALEADKHPNIWLVSFSKGAAEIRLLMQQLGSRFPDNVRGWISISGIVGGTPLATMKFRSALHRLYGRMFFPLLGTSFEAISQMRHDHEFWQDALVLPNDMKCIHVAGVPLLGHVQPLLVERHQLLNEFGTNDGISLLQTTMAAPGHIYPLWGADHFLRTPRLSPLIYRLMHFVNGIE
ncbi:MAG: hypothetical protein M3Q51_01370 [Pseudomonadota bacterium]|nr:hypothetical protein [Pseudomonadota bacterium]